MLKFKNQKLSVLHVGWNKISFKNMSLMKNIIMLVFILIIPFLLYEWRNFNYGATNYIKNSNYL